MRKFVLFVLIIMISSLFAQEPQQRPKILYQYKLNAFWFNPWGGLDFLHGYALLSIDESGGISFEDKFKDPTSILKHHWVEIDYVSRIKKDEIFIYATFHSDPIHGGKNQGNGSFKFPYSGFIHIIHGASPIVQIQDNPAPENLSETDKKTILIIKTSSSNAKIKRKGSFKWTKASSEMEIFPGDQIDSNNGEVLLKVSPNGLIKLYPHSHILIQLQPIFTKFNTYLKLLKGFLWARIPHDSNHLRYATPNAICGIRGTEFKLKVIKEGISCLNVIKGSVLFSDLKRKKIVTVKEGEKSCVIDNGKPFLPIPIKEQPDNVQPFSISGTWVTNFGELRLRQHGDIVTGKYTHDRGKFKGIINGNKLIGMWSEAPTYKPINDAGECVLVFSKDGKSFSGYWRYGFDGKWDGKWNGKKESNKKSK